MISGYNFDKLVESLKKKFTLYNNIKEAILLPSLNLVKNAERKILIKKKRFKNVFESLEKYNIQEEIESLYNIGFDSVFFLYEKAPWYKSLAVCLLGIVEVGLGVLISTIPVINNFSDKLINCGIANIGKGIEMFMNGKDFENWQDFIDFQKSSFYAQNWYEPLIIERDKKKEYKDFYIKEIENNSTLRDKIIVNREETFKNYIDSKLKEIDLNFETEKEKYENIEKNMANIKEKVADNIMKNLKKEKCYRNIFLYFNGDMKNIRKYVLNILSSLMDYNIAKEESFIEYSDESELVEKITEKLEGKIIEAIEKDENIKNDSMFVNDFKNKCFEKSKNDINKLITENNEQNKKSFELEKENLEKNLNQINVNFVEKQKEINNDCNQKLQKKNQETQDKIINEINQKIKLFNEKQNELSQEEREKMGSEIEEKTNNIEVIVKNECDKNKQEIEEELKKSIEEEKQKTEELRNNAINQYKEAMDKNKKEQEEKQKELEEKSRENINKIENLSNDDFKFHENKIICQNEYI
jgi:hypothetical protein